MEEKGSLLCESWFPTRIYYVDHPEAESTNKKLIKTISKWHEKDLQGISRSNHGGWHSRDDMHKRKEFNYIRDWITHNIGLVAHDMGVPTGMDVVLDNMWANVNPKYCYNTVHTHPRGMWSGVYYVQTPENCGNIKFIDPRMGNNANPVPVDKDKYAEKKHSWNEVRYKPIEGRLIIFPSFLLHEVEQNLSDSPRVSISFNYLLADKISI